MTQNEHSKSRHPSIATPLVPPPLPDASVGDRTTGRSSPGSPSAAVLGSRNDGNLVDPRKKRRPGRLRRLTDWLVLRQPSWLTSFLFHLLVLMILGLLVVPSIPRPKALTLMMGEAEDQSGVELKTLPINAEDEAGEIEATPPNAVAPISVPEVAFPILPPLPDVVATDTASDQAPPSDESESPSTASVAVGEADRGDTPGGAAGREGRRGRRWIGALRRRAKKRWTGHCVGSLPINNHRAVGPSTCVTAIATDDVAIPVSACAPQTVPRLWHSCHFWERLKLTSRDTIDVRWSRDCDTCWTYNNPTAASTKIKARCILMDLHRWCFANRWR